MIGKIECSSAAPRRLELSQVSGSARVAIRFRPKLQMIAQARLAYEL